MSDTTSEAAALATSGPTIINAKQAAALLGVHHTTLYSAARRGEIPCRIIGRRFVFVRETLIDWLREDASTNS